MNVQYSYTMTDQRCQSVWELNSSVFCIRSSAHFVPGLVERIDLGSMQKQIVSKRKYG